MEKLDQNVAEAAVEVATEQACSIKKAAPVLLPVALVLGGAAVLFKLFKGRKAKKAAEAEQKMIQEVNPADLEVE